MQLCNSFSPLTKFPLLSDLISSGFPHRATNLLRAFKVAHVVRQVNITPYLLTKLRPHRTLNGPKKSTPVKANGGFQGVTRLFGRSAIFCSATGDCLRLQSKQSLTTLRTKSRPLTIQNFCRVKDRTYSRPECPDN